MVDSHMPFMRYGLLLLLTACAPEVAPVPDVALGHPRTVALEATLRAPWAPRTSGSSALSSADNVDSSAALGRDPHEPLGPLAVFADRAADRGAIAVLDQVQSRIVRYDADGVQIGAVPIPSPATFDAVATADGYGLLVWTPGADAHWSVQAINASGALQQTTRVAADPPTAVLIDTTGGATGSATGDATERLLVEDSHEQTVDVGTGQRFPGRPSGNGWYVQAHKDDLHHVTITWSNADSSDIRAVRLVSDRPVVNLVALEPHGDTVLVGLFLMENTNDKAKANPEIRVLTVDRRGSLSDEFSLPAGEGLDPNRPIAGLPDGSVLQLRPDATGVNLSRVRR